MLPGNVYADPTVTRYHKTQLLGIKDGVIRGKYRCAPLERVLADSNFKSCAFHVRYKMSNLPFGFYQSKRRPWPSLWTPPFSPP